MDLCETCSGRPTNKRRNIRQDAESHPAHHSRSVQSFVVGIGLQTGILNHLSPRLLQLFPEIQTLGDDPCKTNKDKFRLLTGFVSPGANQLGEGKHTR